MSACRNKYNFKVTWEPFLLRPNMPADGVPKPPQYGPSSSGSNRLINIGKEVGIDFTYKQPRFPNTIVAHCALDLALQKDSSGKLQNELQEALFKSYFTDGDYPDVNCVTKLAVSVGMDEAEVKNFISNPNNHEMIQEKAAQSRLTAGSGVPMFVFNGQPGFAGAQPADTIQSVFHQVAEKFPLHSM